MKNKIKSFNYIINEVDINKFENEVGFKMPQDYRKFLLLINGGILQKEYSQFKVKELNKNIFLDSLFGLNINDEVFNLKLVNDEFKEDMLNNTIIIGDDTTGGFLILINNKGIYYWDHTNFFDETSDEKNIFFLSKSFDELINNLL